MSRHNKDIGQTGEKEAVNYLLKKGYQVIEQNFHSHWGEIDIISQKNKTLVFIEVKTRMNNGFGKPYESVNSAKIKKLFRSIQYFLLKKDFKDYKLSLDVISIELNSNLSLKNLKHFENVSAYQ